MRRTMSPVPEKRDEDNHPAMAREDRHSEEETQQTLAAGEFTELVTDGARGASMRQPTARGGQ